MKNYRIEEVRPDGFALSTSVGSTDGLPGRFIRHELRPEYASHKEACTYVVSLPSLQRSLASILPAGSARLSAYLHTGTEPEAGAFACQALEGKEWLDDELGRKQPQPESLVTLRLLQLALLAQAELEQKAKRVQFRPDYIRVDGDKLWVCDSGHYQLVDILNIRHAPSFDSPYCPSQHRGTPGQLMEDGRGLVQSLGVLGHHMRTGALPERRPAGSRQIEPTLDGLLVRMQDGDLKLQELISELEALLRVPQDDPLPPGSQRKTTVCPAASGGKKNRRLWLACAAALVALVIAGLISWRVRQPEQYPQRLVQGDPDKGQVSLDGELVGTAPVLVRCSKSEAALLEIKKPGYHDSVITLACGERGPIVYHLACIEWTIKSEPSGADVTDPGGEVLGQTPLTFCPAGRYRSRTRLRVAKAGFHARTTRALDPKQDEQEQVTLAVARQLLSEPPGARVTAEGQPGPIGQTPLLLPQDLRCPATLYLTRAGYQPGTARLDCSGTEPIVVHLQRLPPPPPIAGSGEIAKLIDDAEKTMKAERDPRSARAAWKIVAATRLAIRGGAQMDTCRLLEIWRTYGTATDGGMAKRERIFDCEVVFSVRKLLPALSAACGRQSLPTHHFGADCGVR